MTPPKAIAIVSGGLDSVTLAHQLAAEGSSLHLLTFDYGQRHAKEIYYAARCAQRLGAVHQVVPLTVLTGMKSALTSEGVPVPFGHYEAPTMAATVVPNRNAIMLAIAYAIAVDQRAELVATAVHAGDHFIYPDCRPAFIVAFDEMEQLATEGFAAPNLRLHAPFVHMTKASIVFQGALLDVPFAETWSCYQGGALHCGKCGTCVERKEAFERAGVPDPTKYEA